MTINTGLRRTMWIGGRRYELRPWYDRPSLEELAAGAQIVERPAEIEFHVRAAADTAGGRSLLAATTREEGRTRDLRGVAGGGVAALVHEIRDGRWILVAVTPPPPLVAPSSGDAAPVDLSDLAPAQEEDEDEEGPLHILIRVYYDPDRPEGSDDKLRLFSTDDEGGQYDQTVDLSSEGDTQREDRHLLVLFRDVVPDIEYSAFLDLGGTEGGYLLFYRHVLGRSHHVDGLPRDT